MTTKERAQRLAEILPYYPEDEHTNFVELLTDMLHWCQHAAVNFDEVLRCARRSCAADQDGAE